MLPAPVAQISPLSPEFQLGLISLLGVAVLVQSLVAAFRRKPPVGEDLVQLRTSIDSLKKSVELLTLAHEKHVAHSAEITALQKEVDRLKTQREEDQRSARSYTAQSNQRIFERIDELAETVAANFQSVERAIGKVEGQLQTLHPR